MKKIRTRKILETELSRAENASDIYCGEFVKANTEKLKLIDENKALQDKIKELEQELAAQKAIVSCIKTVIGLDGKCAVMRDYSPSVGDYIGDPDLTQSTSKWSKITTYTTSDKGGVSQ